MRDFSIGAPFHVHKRDVLLIPPIATRFSHDPDSLATAMLANRLFGLGWLDPLPDGIIARGCLGPFKWSMLMPWRTCSETVLWLAVDALFASPGATALFVGWLAPNDLRPAGDFTAADLRPPESFRMAYLNLIPSYSAEFKRECWRREMNRRHAG